MMTEASVPLGEHLYDQRAYLSRFTEYGASFQELTSGQIATPPEGARFDLAFEGSIKGEKLKGAIAGVDFAEVRTDGRLHSHVHAEITTDDGAKISVFADGVLTLPEDGTAVAPLRYDVWLATFSPRYSWVNKLQVWVCGGVDLNSGEIGVTAYAA